MKIALTVDPEIPVPPSHYGGIERIVYMLVEGLMERGHEVTLFANGRSQVPCRLIPYLGKRSQRLPDTLANMVQIWQFCRANKDVDIVHSFGRLAYLLPLLPRSLPKIQSYQRHVSPRSVRIGAGLAGASITFTACSAYCASTGVLGGGRWEVVYNGVQTERYTFIPRVNKAAPLVFLGRIERIKGVHTAIRVAKATGRCLVIAGNQVPRREDETYFYREVMPYCNGSQIRYIGPVTDEDKSRLLGRAAALLFPVEWGEPFGIVMAEALACGTPVIGFSKGAVPEVIEDGFNGFLCNSAEEMVEAIEKLGEIDRRRCRESCEGRFSDKVLVEQYERIYKTALTGEGEGLDECLNDARIR